MKPVKYIDLTFGLRAFSLLVTKFEEKMIIYRFINKELKLSRSTNIVGVWIVKYKEPLKP